VVHIHTEVPAEHPSARILGEERFGSGTVIDPSGLILTVNYVVMGGESIQVSFTQGRRAKAEVADTLSAPNDPQWLRQERSPRLSSPVCRRKRATRPAVNT
jgi:hypothetical protein